MRFFSERTSEAVLRFGAVLLGNTLLAAAVSLFVIPLGLPTAGTPGLALFINRLTGFSVTLFTYLFYGGTFLLGCIFLGSRFALTTALSSIWYPIAFAVLEGIRGSYQPTSEPLLGTLAAGLLMGLGIGLVLRVGASTGGTDIPLLMLQKYLGTPISLSMWGLDLALLLLQALTVTSEALMLGFVLVALYATVIGRVLVLGRSMLWATLISEHPHLLRDAIYRELDRGVTLLHGQMGYREKECEVLMTVISERELGRLERLVAKHDSAAFLILHRVSRVRGTGFSDKR